MAEVEHPDCPLEAVHKRLDDLHRQWHAAADAYFDPEAFRVAIQSAIQTARTVSFILQSNKRAFPDFDVWYGGWQKTFRDDPLMRWMVGARNKIEKQGDLEAHSQIRAEIVASYLSSEVQRIDVPGALFSAPLSLLKSIPPTALGEHIRKEGILRIQRRWVENTLPDYELLDAVALAYGRLSHLLDHAHNAIGLKVPETTDTRTGEVYDDTLRKGRLPCMIGQNDTRTLDIWLADGRAVGIERIEKTFDRAKAEKVAERYAIKPAEMFRRGSAKDVLYGLFETAKAMFLKDGYHVTMVFLLKGDRPVHFRQMNFEEHGQKYLMMRDLAHEVTRRGADAVIMIGEIWTAAYDARQPYRRAQHAPERREALMATLVSAQNEPVQISALIDREGEKVSLRESIEMAGGNQMMFAPIYEAWGRAIPEEWLGKPPGAAGP